MKSLNKKLYRDIKLNKSQFIVIFIMIFLGVGVFAGIHSYMDGMQISADKYYEQNSFQDLWLVGENFTKEDLNKVKEIENIKDAQRQLTILTTLEGYEDVTLETNFIECNNISKMYVVEGEGFDKEKSGVWLDSYLAQNLGLQVGDEISFTYQNYKITEKILGLVNTPDHVYLVKSENEIFPNHKDYGFVYLSMDEFPKQYIYDELKKEIISKNEMLANMELNNETIEKMIPDFKIEDYYVFSSIIVDVDDVSKINETKTEIENKIEKALAVTDRNSSASYNAYNTEIEEGNTYSGLFTALFLFIAILSVITTMNRFVKKQRIQIGTLKALGIKKVKIIRHYVSYGFWISLLASVIGIIFGRILLGEYFLNMIIEYFEMPNANTVILPIVYIVAVLVVLIVTFVTYLSCRKILKEPAAQALRIEQPKVKVKENSFTTREVFNKLSLSTKWNLRDIARSKARTLMAVVRNCRMHNASCYSIWNVRFIKILCIMGIWNN